MSLDQKVQATQPQADTRPRVSPGRGLPTVSRAYGQMAFAVLLIAGSALVGAVLLSSAGDTKPVLTVGAPVAEGEVVDRGALLVRQVSGVPGAIDEARAVDVVGKTATVDLVEGQVITAAMLADDPIPAAGQATVGLSLKPSQMPTAGLGPGDTVKVLAVPAAESGGDKIGVLAAEATVLALGEETVESLRTVTVVVPVGSAEQLAAYSAVGRVAIVRLPDGQG